MSDLFAATPEPPYVAVIFTSLPSDDDSGYGEMADRMSCLAAEQPGYLGVESANGRPRITVSYWRSEDDARAWKKVAEHVVAQEVGRERWYDAYRVRVASVGRDYGFQRD